MTTEPSLTLEDIAQLDEGIQWQHLDAEEVEGHLAYIARRVLALEQRLATEVRTRRVVVVDEAGFERVVIDTLSTSGWVTVHGNPGGEQGDERYVRLLVDDEGGAGPTAIAGVYVVTSGEEVVALDAMDDAEGAAVPHLALAAIHRTDGEQHVTRVASLDVDSLRLGGGTVVGWSDRC